MRIVFIGPPGAGKGTQCRRLSDYLGVPQLSTGEMLRALRDQDSALARWLRLHLDAGNLAPDHVVMRMVERRLADDDCQRGYLLDGFPRTIVQAELLDQYLDSLNSQLNLVLELTVERRELVERLRRRSQIEDRNDDAPSTVEARLRVFELQTTPLREYYARQGLLQRIDGMRPPEIVFEQIRRAVAAAAA